MLVVNFTYSLPLANPTVIWIHQRYQSIEIVTGVIINIVLVVLHAKETFAIVTAVVFELFKGLEWNGCFSIVCILF